MHTHDLAAWRHEHVFGSGNVAGERGTRLVMLITAAMMVAEMPAGSTTHEQPCGRHRAERFGVRRGADAGHHLHFPTSIVRGSAAQRALEAGTRSLILGRLIRVLIRGAQGDADMMNSMMRGTGAGWMTGRTIGCVLWSPA